MRAFGLFIFLSVVLLFSVQEAKAVELIVNGGFETGDFTGWTRTNGPNPYEIWRVSTTGMGIVDSPLPTATQVVDGSFNAWQGVVGDIGSFLLYQDVTVPLGQVAILKWKHRYQMNLTTYCSGSACGTATFAAEILNTSNVLLQTLYTITTPNSSNTNTGWVSNQLNISAYGGQTIRLRFRTTLSANRQGPGRLEVDAVSISTFVPTAAEVSVSGRVTNTKGAGLGGATITLVEPSGAVRTTISSPLGYYQFDEVEVGQTYVILASKKGYTFLNNPQILSISEERTDVDFNAL